MTEPLACGHVLLTGHFCLFQFCGKFYLCNELVLTCSFHVHPSYGRNTPISMQPKHKPRYPTWGRGRTTFILDTMKGKSPALPREVPEDHARRLDSAYPRSQARDKDSPHSETFPGSQHPGPPDPRRPSGHL